MDFKTADLCDEFGAQLQICAPLFRDYGGQARFAGPIATVQCYENNSLVRERTGEPGQGRVLVVDGGGSLRRALVGDVLAQRAVDNGWSGLLIHGCVRDSVAIGRMPLGIKALATCPLRSEKRVAGVRDVPVQFAGVTFRPGEWLYADEDGVIVAARALLRSAAGNHSP